MIGLLSFQYDWPAILKWKNCRIRLDAMRNAAYQCYQSGGSLSVCLFT